jgi:hypothetical protein
MKTYFIITALLFSSVAFSQDIAALKSKLDSTQANKFGVKRIDWGKWNDTDSVHYWMYHCPKEGYVICKKEVIKFFFTNVPENSTKNASRPWLIEEVMRLNPSRWTDKN